MHVLMPSLVPGVCMVSCNLFVVLVRDNRLRMMTGCGVRGWDQLPTDHNPPMNIPPSSTTTMSSSPPSSQQNSKEQLTTTATPHYNEPPPPPPPPAFHQQQQHHRQHHHHHPLNYPIAHSPSQYSPRYPSSHPTINHNQLIDPSYYPQLKLPAYPPSTPGSPSDLALYPTSQNHPFQQPIIPNLQQPFSPHNQYSTHHYPNHPTPPGPFDQQHTPPYPHSSPFSPFEPTYHPFISPPSPIPHVLQPIHSPRSDYHQPYCPHPPIANQSPIRQDTHQHPSSPLRRSVHNKAHLHSPFVSPRPHWQHHHPSRPIRSPTSPSNPPRHASLFPKSPYSSASSPSTQGPKSPPSLPISQQPLVRGSLAQAKLRGHHFTKQHLIPTANLSGDPSENSDSPRLNRPALPKPPNHSRYALWVGNIPSDASHQELWKFFAGRVPRSNDEKTHNKPLSARLDQRIPSSGVESIHLIARSNCAFVNYTSHQQLEQAITSCNGKPLRPMDPYCKPLLCRVRKPEDSIKSGVGAQRIGGMHRSWAKRFEQTTTKNFSSHNRSEKQQNCDHLEPSNNRTSSTLTSTSNQSRSTTSSFLASHFPRRYFILKSYTDEDLRISVERSIWVSQTHNEPVLDQAFRTSPEGVFLIFSTNQSGEFFGYAKMAGPIWKPGRRYSAPTSPTPDSGKLLRARSVSISGSGRTRKTLVDITFDRLDGPTTTTGLDNLFGVQDNLTISSPGALTPVEGESMTMSENRTHFSPSRRSLPILSSRNLFNRSPVQSYVSKEPKLSNQLEDDHHGSHFIRSHINTSSTRSRSGSNTTTGSRHSFHSSHDDDHPDLMTGRPFKVEWIRVQRLTFYRTKNLRNPFNGNREVKVSRDGTEVEPSVGQAIIDEIDKEYFRLNSS